MTALRPSDIAQKIELALPAAFANFKANGIGDRTRTALTTLGDLGRGLGFMVCCNSSCYPNATEGGWLYDQFWYINHPDKPGFIDHAAMALESEFSKTEPSIDNDFPKLLLARVDVRVWLWQSVTARNHIDLYKDHIKTFRYSLPGDEWVFGVYDWLGHKPLIERFTVMP
jgi:hypothetical protein